MSKIDDLKLSLEDAKNEYNAKNEIRREHSKNLHEYLMSVLEKNISKDGVKNMSCDEHSACIDIANHSIDLSFNFEYGGPHPKKRILKLNFGCFGSFRANDNDEVKYCEVLGHVAGILNVLEQQMLNCDEAKKIWDGYDTASSEAWTAQNIVRRIDDEIKRIEAEEKKESILKKIAAGCHVMVARATSYRSPIVKTIEHITAKNVFFKEDYGKRTKIDELVENLLNGKWMIA